MNINENIIYETLNMINEEAKARMQLKPTSLFLRDIYSKTFNFSGKIPTTLKTGANEIFRANFGEDSEFENNCKTLVKTAFNVDDNDFTIKYLVVSENPTSDTFDACEVIFNKDVFFTSNNKPYIIHKNVACYITNSNTTISDKQLSPQSLGITGNFYKENFLEKITTAVSSSNIPDLIKDLIIYISSRINESTEEDAVSIDDMVIHGSETIFTYNIKDIINKYKNEPGVEETLGQITRFLVKDFGEIIGGLFIINYIKDAKYVNYNNSYTMPMVDYEVNIADEIYGISAKGKSVGHSPSATPALTKLKPFILDGKKENGITFDELLSNSYSNSKEGIEGAKRLFEILVDTATTTEKQKTRRQLITVISEYTDAKAKQFINAFCNIIGYSSFTHLLDIKDEDFEKDFDNMCNDDNKFNEFKKLYDNIESTVGHSSDSINIKTKEDAINLPINMKIGMLLYPLSYNAIDNINNLFGRTKVKKGNVENPQETNVDIISAVIRLAFTHKQIYTGIDINYLKGEIKVKFSFKAMNTGEWEFKCPISTKEPYFSNIQIKLH